jgi:hypothetical protein
VTIRGQKITRKHRSKGPKDGERERDTIYYANINIGKEAKC